MLDYATMIDGGKSGGAAEKARAKKRTKAAEGRRVTGVYAEEKLPPKKRGKLASKKSGAASLTDRGRVAEASTSARVLGSAQRRRSQVRPTTREGTMAGSGKVSFKTKDGKTVSFSPKKGGKGKSKSKAKPGAGAASTSKPKPKVRRPAAKAKPASRPSTPASVGAGKSAARSKAAKKAAATRHREHEKRVRAGKKAARTRAKNEGRHHAGAGSVGAGSTHAQRSKAAKKAARTRAKNARAAEEAAELRLRHGKRNKKSGQFGSTRPKKAQHRGQATKKEVAAWIRKHGLSAAGRLHKVRDNPISGMDYAAAVAGGGVGILAWWLIDDVIATSVVTLKDPAFNGNSSQLVTKGKIDNEFAKDAPIWTGPGLGPVSYRLMASLGLILAPWGASFIPMPDMAKTGLRVVSLGAGLGVFVKLVQDVGAKALGGTAIGQRLFAPQINAQNRMADAAAAAALSPPKQLGPTGQTSPQTAVPAANPYAAVGASGMPRSALFGNFGNFGGAPQLGAGAGAAVQHQQRPGAACCGNCAAGLPCAKDVPPTPEELAAAARASGAGAKADQAGPPAHRPNGRANGAPAADPYAGQWDNLTGGE